MKQAIIIGVTHVNFTIKMNVYILYTHLRIDDIGCLFKRIQSCLL
jgi:hypothetical protein